MTSKEALKKILNHKSYERESSCWDYVKTLYQEEVTTINHDLDRLEHLEKENQGVKDDNTRLWHGIEYANNEIAKLKKAIEILKEVVSLNCDATLETERQFLRLSKEEYELLKEVLGDD